MEYTGKKLIGNVTWSMVSKIYSMLISLVVGALSARYLGPSNYGVLNYGTSLISFFSTVSALGFASTLPVEMVRDKKNEGKIIGSAVVFRFVTSIICFIGIFLLLEILEPNNKLIQVVTMLQAISVVLNTYEIFLYWFQMRLQMKMVTIASMIALTVTAIWRVTLLAKQASVEFFALSNSISALVTGICILFFFWKSKDRPRLSFEFQEGKQLLLSSYHFVISGLAVTLYSQLDRIMLGKIVSSESVGFYSAAMNIAIMWEFVPLALINTARPAIADLKVKNERDYQEKYKLLLLAITIMGICVSVGFMIFGKLIIYILYGESYDPAVPALWILIWATSFSMIGTARVIWLVAENKNQYEKYCVIIGAIVNVILNALFIPRWGIVGASITTLISQFIVACITPYFFKDIRLFMKLYLESFSCFPELLNISKKYLRTVIRKK